MAKLMILLILALMGALSGCGTWEVKFGMSEFNGSQEARTYKVSDVQKK